MRENGSSVFPTRSDTNRPVHLQKTARSLKFRIYEEEKLYYPVTAQLICAFDLRLCFCIGKTGFLTTRLMGRSAYLCLSLSVRKLQKILMVFMVHLIHNARKPVFGVSDQVLHKSTCAPTEDG